MNNKVYVVSYSNYTVEEGCYWVGGDEIDSVWNNKESAFERIKVLANDYIYEQWYGYGETPGKDYKETWNEDNTCIKYDHGDYEHVSFSYKEYDLRSGWVEDNKDLPAYFTTT